MRGWRQNLGGRFAIFGVRALLLAWLAVALMAALFANALIFPVPPRSYRDDSLVIKLDVEGAGKISAVLLRHPGTRRTILYSHGNGEDLGHIMPRLKVLRDMGYNVFAYDYPGYGTSEGSPDETNVYASAEAAFQYLTRRLRLQPGELILYGRSLGAAPSIWLAARHDVQGLVTESAFVSAFRVPLPFRLLWWDRFDNASLLPQVRVPALIIHGTRDRVVPFGHAKELLNESPPGSLFLFVDAGHNDIVESSGEIYAATLQNYLSLVQQNPIPDSSNPNVQETRTIHPR